jgi:parvulin-like peptidyl-prolyl isomerase
MNKLAAAIVISILIFLAGCDSDPNLVVAKVGGKTIELGHVKDFDLLFPMIFTSADEEYEAKKRFVDSLIEVKLLIIGGYQADLDIDSEVMQIIDIEKPKFLLDELFKSNVLSKVSVTDAEIRDNYDKLKEEVRAKHILVDSKKLIDSLYQAVTDGAEFEQLARDYSLDQTTAMNGGDLGYIRWGWVVSSFHEELFKLSPGQISKPFETEMGWHIAMMVDRRDTDPGPFKALRDRLRAQIQSSKRQKVMMEYLEGLREKVEIKMDEEVVQTILDQMNRIYPDTLGGKPFKKSTIDLTLLEQYQKSQILAYFRGGEMTVEEYMNAIGQVPVRERPDFRNREGVTTAVFNMNLNQILANEALAEGLDKTETYMNVITEFKEAVMADKMRDLVMQGTPEIVDDEIYDYYNTHIDEFEVEKRLRIREIMVEDLALAESLRTTIDGGADFEDLAEEFTERPGMKARKGNLGFIEPYRYPAVYTAADNMEVGDIKGPVQVGDDWSIILLEDFKPPVTRPIEEAAAAIHKELKAVQQRKTLNSWLAARKAETTIEVDYDLIWEAIDREEYEED